MDFARLQCVGMLNLFVFIAFWSPNSKCEMGEREGDRAYHKDELKRIKSRTPLWILISWLISGIHLYYHHDQSVSYYETFLFVLSWVGVMSRVWCYHALGQYFTFAIGIRSGHELIRTGPYKYLVHPSYLAQITVIATFLLFCHVSFYLTGFIISAVLYRLVLRMLDEETMLQNHFGEDFTDYASERWHLIPWVW